MTRQKTFSKTEELTVIFVITLFAQKSRNFLFAEGHVTPKLEYDRTAGNKERNTFTVIDKFANILYNRQ